MASGNPRTPNILFILSDDQGAWAMGCAGNDELDTPNLDRLASTGIRFDNFFCASPSAHRRGPPYSPGRYRLSTASRTSSVAETPPCCPATAKR